MYMQTTHEEYSVRLAFRVPSHWL